MIQAKAGISRSSTAAVYCQLVTTPVLQPCVQPYLSSKGLNCPLFILKYLYLVLLNMMNWNFCLEIVVYNHASCFVFWFKLPGFLWLSPFKFWEFEGEQACMHTHTHFLWGIVNKNVDDLLQHSCLTGKQVCSGYRLEFHPTFLFTEMISQLPLRQSFHITFLQLLVSVIV